MEFVKAARSKSKLRLALSGPSGSGKTMGALLIAKGIVDEMKNKGHAAKVAVIDAEEGSASLYSHILDFDVLNLKPPFSPERYIEAIRLAEENNYDIIIPDSITHEWKGAGGILEIVELLAKSKYRGNSYAAWNEGTPRHQKFLDALLQSPAHIIGTMRSKTAYVEAEKNGRKTYEKVGMAPEQRDNIEYEFTAVLDLNNNGNYASASKDRTEIFKDPFIITTETGKKLFDWLESGVDEFSDLKKSIEKFETIDALDAAKKSARSKWGTLSAAQKAELTQLISKADAKANAKLDQEITDEQSTKEKA